MEINCINCYINKAKIKPHHFLVYLNNLKGARLILTKKKIDTCII